MKYLSLFSGVGGFELGIKQAYEICNADRSENRGGEENTKGDEGQRLQPKEGKEVIAEERPTSERNNNLSNERPLCIGFSEIDKYATKVYKHHFPEHKEYGDITKINEKELPDFDLLVGGFPCQSFSIAGKRGGFDDTRGTMFFEIARIVREKQPRLLLLENVKGLLSHDKGNTFTTIISTLDELGYDCQWQVLNSKNHGVPQNRERVFIIGHLRGTSRPEVFPFGGEDTKITYTDKTLVADYRYDEGLRIRKEPISPTLCASMREDISKSLFIVDDPKVRRLTPTECERLQGFPDNWTNVDMSDTQRYKQCGNAVTVNVIRDIVARII